MITGGEDSIETPEKHYEGSRFNINPSERVRFEVPTAASMKMLVSCVVAPCILVKVYRRFRGASCLHHQGST
jgi:hypothetical protein